MQSPAPLPGFEGLTEADLERAGDVSLLMAQIRQQQAEIEQIQRSVEAMQVTGCSRHNEVQVTARGSGEIASVYIDPDAIADHTADELGDIIKQAVNDALRLVREASAARFQPIIDAAGQPRRR